MLSCPICAASSRASSASRARRASLALITTLRTAAWAAALAGARSRSRKLSAGSAPLSSAEVSVAQPASVTWVLLR